MQGRIVYLDQQTMVLQAATHIIVDLPQDDSAYDLTNGSLAVGAMVNTVVMPGARLELLGQSAPAR